MSEIKFIRKIAKSGRRWYIAVPPAFLYMLDKNAAYEVTLKPISKEVEGDE